VRGKASIATKKETLNGVWQSIVPRRKVLEAGLGIAAVTVTGLPVKSVLAGAPTTTDRGLNGPGVGTVIAIDGDTVVATVGSPGAEVSATIAHFPSDVMPRIGDTVAIVRGIPRRVLTEAACRGSTQAATDAETAPTATPVGRWTAGIPAIRGGKLMIGDLELVASPTAVAAAQRGARVTICTLESARTDHLVLAVRPL